MALDNTPDDTLAGKLGTSLYNTDANLQDFGIDPMLEVSFSSAVKFLMSPMVEFSSRSASEL